MKASTLVLVVDDNPVQRQITKALIHQIGFQVIEAKDGSEGVDQFLAHKSQICLVVIDYEMPKQNGFEAICRIREEVQNGLEVPIILYSATPSHMAPESFSSSLISQVVDKNKGTTALREAIVKWLGKSNLLHS